MKISEVFRVIEEKVPAWFKVAVIIATFLGIGYQTYEAVAAVPPAIAANTDFRQNSEPLLKYLTCRSIERDEGRTSQACVYFLHESEYYQEFIQMGIIRRGENN